MSCSEEQNNCPKCGGSDYWKDGYTASKARSPRRRCKKCGTAWTVTPKKGGRNAVTRRKAEVVEETTEATSTRSSATTAFLTAEKGKAVIISRSFLGGMEIKIVDDVIEDDIVKETMVMDGEFRVAKLKTWPCIAITIASGDDDTL